jgi:hypothetical protein
LRSWPSQRLGAELAELRRTEPQCVEVGARQQQAEDVFGRLEASRAGRIGRQRGDGEALARATHLVVGGGGGIAHAHVPALDDVQVRRGAVRRVDDRGADGEIAQVRPFGDELEILLAHARERQVSLEETGGRLDDEWGRAQGEADS